MGGQRLLFRIVFVLISLHYRRYSAGPIAVVVLMVLLGGILFLVAPTGLPID